MANGFNFLTAPLTMIKQVGEQASNAIQSVGTGLTTMASNGLDTIISGVPGFPGNGGAAAAGFPSPKLLLPTNLEKVISNAENILIPAGLPKPSQAAKVVQQQPTETPPATTTTEPTSEPPAMAKRQRVVERRGY